MARVLIADSIASAGVNRLRSAGHDVVVETGRSPSELALVIGPYEALVVRSATQVTAEVIAAGHRLQVIGRAGVGVDNIDLEEATKQGIPVVNAPTSSTIAAAEHAIALMLALARHVPQAHLSMQANQWTPRQFVGVELRNKTLGIVGLGRIGSEVARRARAFQMHLIAFDPYVSADYARNLDVELVELERLLREADFITLHSSLNAGSRGLFGPEQFMLMKQGVYVVNAARGGLIDEALLLQGLESGRVAGVALDVYSEEPPHDLPLLKDPRVVVTPHLGASTLEAQIEVATDLADQILAVLSGGSAQHTVNAPYVPDEVREMISPLIPVATFLGKTAIQLAGGQLESVNVQYAGSVAQYDTSILTAATLVGLLSQFSEERVNLLNARVLAAQRALAVTERKAADDGEVQFTPLTVEVRTSEGTTVLGGASVYGQVHLTRVNSFALNLQPTGRYMMFAEHRDQPGTIGRVGTICGEHDINISFMEVGRRAPRGDATMVVGLDDPMPHEVLAKLRNIPGILRITVVEI